MLTCISYQVDMKHLQQQQDYIEKRQCKSEASLRDMAQFYLKLNSKMQDIMNKLDEIVRKVCMISSMSIRILELRVSKYKYHKTLLYLNMKILAQFYHYALTS